VVQRSNGQSLAAARKSSLQVPISASMREAVRDHHLRLLRACLTFSSFKALGHGVHMKIWQCFSGLAQQSWFYTDDGRIAVTNQGTPNSPFLPHSLTHLP